MAARTAVRESSSRNKQMTDRFIPIVDIREATRQTLVPDLLTTPDGKLQDALRRPLHDLRISVTDRCNFRCVYCMPKEVFDKDYPYLPHKSLLSFEEIERLVKLFIEHGVTKIRLTGGEPLLRKNIERLIEKLSRLVTREGKPLDLTLTTNGSLLARKAQDLKNAGLSRVTVSLDSLADHTFKLMNDVDFPVSDVLDGIDAAHKVGLGPIKINMVVKAGMNDQEILPMARHFKGSPYQLRYIEYMDVGNSNGWKMDEVVSSQEVIARIAQEFPLEPVDRHYAAETAARWRYQDGDGEIGVISSVTQAFCHDCTRARLSTEGKLYTCLFATHGHDLRELLRSNISDAALSSAIAAIWTAREDRYSELRTAATTLSRAQAPRIEMSYIGG